MSSETEGVASAILILYSTTDGHTREIGERLREVLAGLGHEVELVPVSASPSRPLEHWDTIVLGAAIRYGRHKREVYDFVRRHGGLLASRPNAFFSVNAVGRKPHKRQADTNPYVRKFLSEVAWHPQQVEIFGGKIDYPRYGRFDRAMIRFIMWMTKGPTDPRSVTDFTDWDQVDAFARRLGGSHRQAS